MSTPIRNPHRHGMLPLIALAGLALLITLAALGAGQLDLVNPALAWIGLIFFVVLSLMLSIIWFLGVLQTKRVKAFLESERPLVRWTYSAAEWQQLTETRWQEEKGDWKVQWGCLTLLLGLSGLLTGVLLGLEGEWYALVLNAMIGAFLGGLAGAVIGGLVAGGNFLGTWQAYQSSQPGMVALGPDEIYSGDDYFRGDGVNGFIRTVAIQRGRPTKLVFQLVVPPRPRMPREEQWIVPVPDQFLEKIEDILPLLTSNQDNRVTE